MAEFMPPTPGRIVWFQTDARAGHDYFVAATVAVTLHNLVPEHVAAGKIEGLESEMHVHLLCAGPDGWYSEKNVPFNPVPLRYDEDGLAVYERGTWRWPERS